MSVLHHQRGQKLNPTPAVLLLWLPNWERQEGGSLAWFVVTRVRVRHRQADSQRCNEYRSVAYFAQQHRNGCFILFNFPDWLFHVSQTFFMVGLEILTKKWDNVLGDEEVESWGNCCKAPFSYLEKLEKRDIKLMHYLLLKVENGWMHFEMKLWVLE